MRRNTTKIIALALLVFAVSFYIYGTKSTKAATQITSQPAHNVTGQAWSSNIGWINFSCDTDPAGCVSANGSYGVDIDSLNNISGQAWSSNIGWIAFGANAKGPTNDPNYPLPAKYDPTTDSLTGWARACAGQANGDCSSGASRADGWDGWISLSGTGYGAKFTGGNGQGAAWGSDGVGWIDFSGVKFSTEAPIVQFTNCPIIIPLNSTAPYAPTLNWKITNPVSNCTATTFSTGSDWTTSPISTTTPNSKIVNIFDNNLPKSFTLTCVSSTGQQSFDTCVVSKTPVCTSDIWTCGDWSACANNVQTRTCTKVDCPSVISRSPLTTQSCVTPPKKPKYQEL